MMDKGIAQKYAEALMDACREKNIQDQVEKDFNNLQKMMQSNEQLGKYLYHPLVAGEEKIKMLQEVGKRFHPYFLNFLQLLVQKKRITLFNAIHEAFFKMLFSSRGYLLAEVYTPFPLEEDQKNAMLATLARRFQRKLELQQKVAPGQKGGLIIRVGDMVFDGSVSTFLKQAYRQMAAARN